MPAEEVAELAKFVIASNLALEPPRDDALQLAAQEMRRKHSLISRVVHGYLFFKIPLMRPERFLNATMPFVAPLYSRAAVRTIILISIIGIYFASRQWDIFVSTFLDFLSFEGALSYGATLIVVKALHELGHAYTATRAGVRVNTIGVAFMVLTPILYTDVTDAWRLRNRRDKLAIDSAGIVVELALAGLSIFLWAFLPDGPLRSAAFITATTSLVMGLMVNLNPLMRFDGYHLLADAWGVPNLQSRSNALAQWRLREMLFKIDHEPPELFPIRQQRMLIIYAYSIWIYRFFLFLGIALVVYHMFFKALGIVLFGVEIVWFILLPIVSELKEWWKMRAEIIKTRRTAITAGIVAACSALIIVPWSSTVTLQGVALSHLETRIYAPRPARVVSFAMTDEGSVSAGEKVLTLNAPDLDHELAQTKRQIELVRVQLDRIAGDPEDLSNRVVLDGELARHRTNLAGLEAEQKRLVVLAPHAGTARDVDRDLQPGEWIDDVTPIARIVANTAPEVHGYLNENDIWRVASGASVTFIPEDPTMARRHGRVVEIVQTGIKMIELPYLASVFGGAVASDKNSESEIKPRAGHHLIRVKLDGSPVNQAIRGTLHVTGQRESIASAIWRRVLQVLIRESSA